MSNGPKFILLVGDGMSDRPGDFPGGRTPLAAAATPNLDRMAAAGETGWAATIPEGMEPGSDVANMALMGYDPHRWYTGRAPLEAASQGIELAPDQTAYRCNMVNLVPSPSGDLLADDAVMGSYSAGHITTPEAGELVAALKGALDAPGTRFNPGISYRHLLVLDDGPRDVALTPPHNISGRPIGGHLPSGDGSGRLLDLMCRALPVLAGHPVNAARLAAGKPAANSIWLWGQGGRPSMPLFREQYGLDGAVITAVDLVRGLGRVAGMEVLDVPGATGWIDTNYEGKVAAALEALERVDFVFLHVEAPDEAGHEGREDLKIQAVTDLDARVVGPLLKGLERFPDWSLLVTPDHPTPVALKTHTADPVPWVLLRSGDAGAGDAVFHETALLGRPILPGGEALMRRLLGRG